DDRRVLELRRLAAEQARALARRRRDDDGVRVELVEGLDLALELHTIAEDATRGVAVHPAEGLQREDEVGIAARPEERGSHGEQPGFAVDLVGRQVERGPDEDVPEALDRRVTRPEAAKDGAEALAGARPCVAAARSDYR